MHWEMCGVCVCVCLFAQREQNEITPKLIIRFELGR